MKCDTSFTSNFYKHRLKKIQKNMIKTCSCFLKRNFYFSILSIPFIFCLGSELHSSNPRSGSHTIEDCDYIPIGYPMPNFFWYMDSLSFFPVLVPVYNIDLMLISGTNNRYQIILVLAPEHFQDSRTNESGTKSMPTPNLYYTCQISANSSLKIHMPNRCQH